MWNMGLRAGIRTWCRNRRSSGKRIKLNISNWFYRILVRFLFRQYSKEPAVSEETSKTYHSNGRIYTIRRKIFLKNGGTSEENRVYRDNGKLLSLSQKMTYEKETHIRYTNWSDLGHRRLDFAARNGKLLYLKYHPSYFKEKLSSASTSTKPDNISRHPEHIGWWFEQI